MGCPHVRYIYESDAENPTQDQALDAAQTHGDIDIEDAAGWNEDKREEVYMRHLLPLSVKNRKRIRGKLRSHKAGKIHFTQGVLITDTNFYVGEEIIEFLEDGDEDHG